jgi:hypothetical protein
MDKEHTNSIFGESIMNLHPHRICRFPRFRLFFTLTILLTILPIQAFGSEACSRAAFELNASINRIESKGGLWGYVEKVAELREKSFLGLQADSVLKQLVVRFETLCENGKPPTPETFNAIQDMLSRARMMFNTPADRMPPDKVISQVTAIKEDAGKLLGTLPHV